MCLYYNIIFYETQVRLIYRVPPILRYTREGQEMPYLLLSVILLMMIALWLLWQSRRAQINSGLPVGEIIYSDTGAWQRVEQSLISRRYGLVGKPDYLLTGAAGGKKGAVIPVEVKSGKRPATPSAGHLLQLGVYCILVEEAYGVTPSHGLLHYADATLRIPFTAALRQEVLAAAEALRGAESARTVHRDHQVVARCRVCGYRHACGSEALL
jgi:CRISPR-associated exonuclease Cas4